MAPWFWFTDLPSWGTYLSPHATGRFWSCSTFDWPKRCRLIRVEALWEVRFCVGIGFCHLRVELWKLAWHCFGVVFVWHWLIIMTYFWKVIYQVLDHLSGMSRCALPGCNMRRIAECTGAKVRIRGQGSNSKEVKDLHGHQVILQNAIRYISVCRGECFEWYPQGFLLGGKASLLVE